MLLYQSTNKYIRLNLGFTYLEFINEGDQRKFGLSDAAELQIFDETDTAVEEDILLELVEANPDVCMTVRDSFLGEDHSTPSSLTDTMSPSSDNDLSSQREWGAPTCRNVSSFEVMNTSTTEVSESEAAKEMVESALLKKPGGDDVLEEYKSENSLKHSTRRQLVNILASHMTEMHGKIPSRKQKEKYALGIISLFPSLKDPFSRKGYEHFYDGEKDTGYLSWRLRTMSRKNRTTRSQQAVPATVLQAQGPNRPRSAPTVPHQLDGDACREALSFLVHSPDEASVFEKMKITLQHRQDLVRDPQRTADVFKTFPRLLDVKGLLTQDLLLLFELCRLLNAAETLAENDDTSWDSDMACLLLLLYLLPPTAGRKRTKISPSDAVDKMVHFHKSCCSIDEHLRGRKGQQPYILAAGRTRNWIDTFFIVIDKQLIPCQATSSLGAFDELFKSHYVFNLSYEESLVPLYTFVQTTVYNIDTTDESPRICELRAKLLN
ncbi:hypothetical protein KUCAC02_025420 [Chaenocephalus aceratus]|uniref:Uncharacterized protein n=1 Tax=Chaenocephalus aceratus TaxID=36190 RepID=A0ACB9VV85_CHAAC|nr:hypothetical protein KUCAC02_025420 [Chaenocephalus aceratus]